MKQEVLQEVKAEVKAEVVAEVKAEVKAEVVKQEIQGAIGQEQHVNDKSWESWGPSWHSHGSYQGWNDQPGWKGNDQRAQWGSWKKWHAHDQRGWFLGDDNSHYFLFLEWLQYHVRIVS